MPRTATSPGSRRGTLLLAALAATVAWFLLVLLWADGPFALTFDDAYYYFAIARNLAEGRGSTFDGINATNGYHPLWMAICVVPFGLGLDDLGAARALLLVQVVAGWGVTAAIVAALVDDADNARTTAGRGRDSHRNQAAVNRVTTAVLATVFFLALLNPFVTKTFVNGLESGIVAPIHAALLWRITRQLRRAPDLLDAPPRWRYATAALLALAFLARTDAVLLFATLGLWGLAEAVTGLRSGTRTAGPATRALVDLFALPGVVAVVYLVLNQRAFGTPVQISGVVKRAEVTPTVIVAAVVMTAAAFAVGRHGHRRLHGVRARRATQLHRAAAFAVATTWYAAFAVLVVAYYVLFQTQQWLWYFAPVLLYLLIVFVLAVADLLDLLATPGRTNPSARRVATLGSLVLVLPVLAGVAFQAPQFADPTIRSIQVANRDAGVWIRDHLGRDAVLASWDAGAVGYFSHRSVVNLDGVVNSLAFHDETRAGRLGRFLRCERVGYVVNHGLAVDGDDPDIVALIRKVWGPEAPARPEVIHRAPFRYSGTTNTGGFEVGGEHELDVFVYRVDPERVGPRPDDRCP